MANPTCPTDCSSNLAPVDFSKCNPITLLSEIQRIFLAKSTAAPFADIEDAAEWLTRIDPTSVIGDDYIRVLTVIGDKPAPTVTEKAISGGRTVVINKTHVINATIDEVGDINHEFIRQLECGGQYKMWYETAGGIMFGGDAGIDVSAKGDMVLARGEENMVYNLTFTWKNKFTEERVESPIFS